MALLILMYVWLTTTNAFMTPEMPSSFRHLMASCRNTVSLAFKSTWCPWTLCGWSTKGLRRAHFLRYLEGSCSVQLLSLPHIVWRGCSSSQYLQPPPPPALVDKTPTPPTANSNSALRLHGYAGLLSKIKPLNPLFAVWWSSGESRVLPCFSCSLLSRD